MKADEFITEHIVKVKGGYRLVSKKSGRNLGTYPTRAGAENRERQVQYFKHATKESIGAEEFANLDEYLVKLCDLIIQGQHKDPDYYGYVAAAILDPDGNYVQSINIPRQGKRVHAERAAIEKYQKQYGEIPNDSIIITTLSPCDEKNDETADERWGESCSDLINHLGIREVYCGYRDPSQVVRHNHYRETVTDNAKIRKLCKQFASTFLDTEQLDELAFMGSQCTKDCSGHQAGYAWAKRNGARPANTASPSFNNGVAIAQSGR